MTAPKPEVRIPFSAAGIPEELKALPRWMLWRMTWNAKQNRWGKVPYQPNGRPAKSTDPATWCTFDEAASVLLVDEYDGLGFAFNGDGLVGIDLDKAVAPDGTLSEVAAASLETVPGYAELSPSGRGLHIITRAPDTGAGKASNGVEVYSKGRYFTFTGSQINGHDSLPAEPQDISAFLARHFSDRRQSPQVIDDNDPLMAKQPMGRPLSEIRKTLFKLDPDMEEPLWLKVVWALKHETEASDEGFSLGLEWSAMSDKFDEGAFTDRWNRAKDMKANAFTWRSVERLAQAGARKETTAPDGGNPFVVHDWQDYKQNYLSTPWIIKSVLPQAEVGVLYGPSGCGKTFFILDMAATIARGAPWRGKRVSNCDVVYIAAEAREGIKKRMDAYDQFVCAEGRRPRIIANAPNMLSTDTIQLAAAIGSAGLIIIDTMAAAHSGDENSAQDMNAFLAGCKQLSLATGAMVLAVHHTGKEESKGMRGSSAIFSGADFVMEVFKNEQERKHAAVLTKSRDDANGVSFGFRLERVVVGKDQDGDDVTTCVVVPIDEEVTKKSSKVGNLADSRYAFHREILRVFEEATEGSMSAQMQEVEILEAVTSQFPSKRKDNILRNLLKLVELGIFSKNGPWYRFAGDAPQVPQVSSGSLT